MTAAALTDRDPATGVDQRSGTDGAGGFLAPVLPRARGPITSWLLAVLTGPGDGDPADVVDLELDRLDALVDDDLHLALHISYELAYRGFDGVDDRWEWDPAVLQLRQALEQRFERRLRDEIAERRMTEGAGSVTAVLDHFTGPSLSAYVLARGTAAQFAEFAVHRSAYQLKEADPHSWVLPRISGARKSALVEIQADEYGNGRPGASHAELFADAMRSLGLDATYGAHVDRLPGVSLATGNLISMFGLQRRLRAALLGHLAAFELTSVTPMSRYSAAASRLGLGPEVRRFYDVHVSADEHHGRLAAEVLVGGDPAVEGLRPDELRFGVAALLVVEDRFARHLLHEWAHGRSSLRPEAPAG